MFPNADKINKMRRKKTKWNQNTNKWFTELCAQCLLLYFYLRWRLKGEVLIDLLCDTESYASRFKYRMRIQSIFLRFDVLSADIFQFGFFLKKKKQQIFHRFLRKWIKTIEKITERKSNKSIEIWLQGIFDNVFMRAENWSQSSSWTQCNPN